MTAAKRADVPAILARHGVAPDADAETLTAALVARGWRVTVEDVRVGAVQRHRVQATRILDAGRRPFHAVFRESVRATGHTPVAALGLALAKALERGSSSSHGER